MKIKSLQGLRGLAAFTVMAFHFFTNFYPALVSNVNQIHTSRIESFIATPLIYSGIFSVCIFFVLSGFVLSYKFFVTKDNQTVVASAYKRYLRLAIPAIFSILLFWIFSYLPIQNGNYNVRNYSIFYLIYEGFIGTFFRYKATINPVLWTMSYEFYGSFIVYSFCALFGKSKHRVFMYIFAFVIFWRTYFLAFILGMLISDISINRQNILAKIDNKIVKIVLLIVGLFLGSYPKQVGIVSINILNTIYAPLSGLSNADSFYQIIGALIIITVLLKSKKLNKFFSSVAMQFLGKVSFSMYLIHGIIILYCAHPLFNFIYKRSISYLFSFLVTIILIVPLILVISYIVYKYVDKSAINCSNYIYKKWLSNDNVKNFSKSFTVDEIRRFISKTGIYIRNNTKKLIFSFGLTVLLVTCSVNIIRFDFLYKDENVKLEIEAKVPRDDTYQVFYTTKNGEKTFNEFESVGVKVKAGESFQNILFELPVNEITSVRLDFGSYTGTIILKSVYLQKGNINRQVEISNLSSLFLNQIDKTNYKDNILELTSNLVDPFVVLEEITQFGGVANKSIDYIRLMEMFIITFILVSIPIWRIKRTTIKTSIPKG